MMRSNRNQFTAPRHISSSETPVSEMIVPEEGSVWNGKFCSSQSCGIDIVGSNILEIPTKQKWKIKQCWMMKIKWPQECGRGKRGCRAARAISVMGSSALLHPRILTSFQPPSFFFLSSKQQWPTHIHHCLSDHLKPSKKILIKRTGITSNSPRWKI